MIVDGAELADPFFALCVEGLYGEITAYVFDPANLDSRLFFDTWWGTVQGDVLSARLASLVILPAQRTFFSILRKKYPQALISAGPPLENEEKISEACTSRLSGQDIEELHEMGVDGIFTNHPSFAQNVIAGLTTAGNDPILHY